MESPLLYRQLQDQLHQWVKYWIATADIKGFRIDMVKHMDIGATRYFVSVIREFTQSIGKENFFLLGEITGGRGRAYDTLELTGHRTHLHWRSGGGNCRPFWSRCHSP